MRVKAGDAHLQQERLRSKVGIWSAFQRSPRPFLTTLIF